jgi:hypothetical protein
MREELQSSEYILRIAAASFNRCLVISIWRGKTVAFFLGIVPVSRASAILRTNIFHNTRSDLVSTGFRASTNSPTNTSSFSSLSRSASPLHVQLYPATRIKTWRLLQGKILTLSQTWATCKLTQKLEVPGSNSFDPGHIKRHPSLSNQNISPWHSLAMHGEQHKAVISGIPSDLGSTKENL